MSSHPRLDSYLEEWKNSTTHAHLAADPDFNSSLETVLAGSEYVLAQLERNQALLDALIDGELILKPRSQQQMDDSLAEALSEVDSEDQLNQVLRQFRHRHMIHIIWRDLGMSADLNETLESLSALADVCIQQAARVHYKWLVEKHGVPRDENGIQQHLVVIGMGKLGARELNMSSDIDLIYTYPHRGQTDGDRSLDNETFFTRLCQKLTQALNSQTIDGFVFRTDTRLRPYGDSGPLAPSFDFMEIYYESQAREWERYAMIKARIIYSEDGAGQELMTMLRPFVYRRYLDFGAIESLRSMKQMISDNLKMKGMRDNVKLGPGGIREIEFIGQVFQLMRGGRDPELQIRPIQQVLERLAEKELIPHAAADDLLQAYRFLRLTENRIQAWRDEQTHLLPEDQEGLQRLATLMQFDSVSAFIETLSMHRNRVQQQFEALFNADTTEEEPEDAPLARLWRNAIDDEQRIPLLESIGCKEAQAADDAIRKLQESRTLHAAGPRGSDLIAEIVPHMLGLALPLENSAETIERLGLILETIARRTTYLALLKENISAMQGLVKLLSASPWFVHWISRQPILLDSLIDPRQLYQPLTRADLKEELEQQLVTVSGDLEQEMEVLRQFVATNRLRVAAADVSEIVPLMIVSDYLTEIAEVTLEAALDLAWRDMTERHGKPSDTGDGYGFVIIAYGKLGGIELGYGSDLDLVFLHNSSPNSMTDGKRQLAAENFYARLAQRLIHIMTTRTPSGQLYEIDMRLRPNGNSGLLVTSLSAFEKYQHNNAWTWEHQALVRARPVAGDPGLVDSFATIRQKILCEERDADALREEVIKMREKMRDSLDKSSDDCFDVKQGRGGITDIEFIVQHMILRWASQHPELCQYSDNIRQLESLDHSQLLPDQWGERLSGLYRALRAHAHRSALMEKKPIVGIDQLAQERKLVAEAWQLFMLE
ncbi:bifunctional glutamine synthetase adenylyltransferase/deadenyltransferase [Solemya velum gill symbiont]|uniref:bifunctional [glutamate--ammonia ligase]-adenylyl-L-tyrosine phosphorylase/[glutamate--ammonia-ligase] adenylyltransferase n=1 Tax=Solemya velum gill symbiont TaxID=2340 RepID=UPI00099703B4|nr:bifunctional [glutamate--ammonia ligase]-adenylyl-L-tyrosine phosphorylase/[glutamate--ammonia-ligase] adenylyltransferase [Solemya velum gill symbiont]OOZ14918.1 bifunctional glutamine synthetase adenylyltransferase/deadenyltransferase [Solemya velum gill symbiont]OOZ17201.1 bifunctional glutamine synthetase adenylyltransferase/deadenyltransferase [Solemya velum gill symbiont]OOZ19557.1 bifunctional glutamine synthetase adenylyltransferase/deadenyltransferase [Solemya velum gill symbiont]OO